MTTPPPEPLPTVHQVPGVVYTLIEGRAHVLDTGLEVFEIIRKWKMLEENWERLTKAYHWLTADHLEAALEFYRYNPELVDVRLELEQRASTEEHWLKYPDSKPPYR